MNSVALAASVMMCLGPTHPPARPASIAAAVAASGGTFDRNRNDFDILLTAVQAAGLVSALADPAANLTVFAPTDGAFIRTARDLGYTGQSEAGAWQFLVGALTDLGGGDPIPILTNILKYHVVGQQLNVLQLWPLGRTDEEIPTLLDGANLRYFNGEIIDAEPEIANPHLAPPYNLVTGNGIIHGINRVLLPVNLPGGLIDREPAPNTLASFIAGSGTAFDTNGSDYDLLLRALITADLFETVGDLSLNVTLFAPNDAAFVRTAQDLGYAAADEEGAWNFLVGALTTLGGGNPVPVLSNILLYHVSPTRLSTPQIYLRDARNQPIATLLSGAAIEPSRGTLIDADPEIPDARLIVPRDVWTRNGTIQTVDRVLIPVDL